MVLRGALHRRYAVVVISLFIVFVAAMQLTADARATADRCADHSTDSVARARMVTGSGADVVVIGDSWSVGLGQPDLSVSWPSRLEGRVRVAGFSGSGFSTGASPCESVRFADRAQAALRSHPDLVIVEGGLNDFDQPDADIVAGFTQLMGELRGVPVVVLGPANAPARRPRVGHVDALLRGLADEYSVPYVDTSDLRLPYLYDGLHLTTTGHREFGDAVAERLTHVSARPPKIRP